MKTRSQFGWLAFSVRAVAAVAAFGLSWAVWGGDAPGPDQVREEVRKLEEKARDLKAAGQAEDAERVMNEVRESRGKLERMTAPSRERPAVAQRRREMQQRMGELKLEMKRQMEQGRQAEAEELREQMQRLEREFRAMGGGEAPREFQRQEGPRPAGKLPPMDPARRLEHLQRAVENLRAGGLPELAARLEQAGQRMREHLERSGPGGAPFEEIARLRAEVRELRQGMQEMKRRIEEVAQRQGRVGPRGER